MTETTIFKASCGHSQVWSHGKPSQDPPEQEDNIVISFMGLCEDCHRHRADADTGYVYITRNCTIVMTHADVCLEEIIGLLNENERTLHRQLIAESSIVAMLAALIEKVSLGIPTRGEPDETGPKQLQDSFPVRFRSVLERFGKEGLHITRYLIAGCPHLDADINTGRLENDTMVQAIRANLQSLRRRCLIGFAGNRVRHQRSSTAPPPLTAVFSILGPVDAISDTGGETSSISWESDSQADIQGTGFSTRRGSMTDKSVMISEGSMSVGDSTSDSLDSSVSEWQLLNPDRNTAAVSTTTTRADPETSDADSREN
ncbi:hypothetical protein BDZ85DRAFT_282011 [Elsinoe ampelina]|uniref:Uncharacterized protein n=1 Tax=Elsinoe ampelina TaxID=302913 RepID=A0A6A6GC71_9PEZI|nr:hypothetical protein BDZ85DRAFT_282011 [Elsinoe ampelina]